MSFDPIRVEGYPMDEPAMDPTKAAKRTVIRLDPAGISSAHAFNAFSQLHLTMLQKTLASIEKLCSKADANDASASRRHQNIAVLGRRGAGKTSFLMALLAILHRCEEADAYKVIDGVTEDLIKEWKSLGDRVFATDLIEPSRLERGEHLLARILGELIRHATELQPAEAILKAEKAGLLREFLDAAAAATSELTFVIAQNRLETTLKEGGDESLFEEVARSRSANRVELAVGKVVRAFLAFVGRKKLIVALDDADMTFERTAEILESIRLYLTHPDIVVLVTGDLPLFRSVLHRDVVQALGR